MCLYCVVAVKFILGVLVYIAGVVVVQSGATTQQQENADDNSALPDDEYMDADMHELAVDIENVRITFTLTPLAVLTWCNDLTPELIICHSVEASVMQHLRYRISSHKIHNSSSFASFQSNFKTYYFTHALSYSFLAEYCAL